MTSSFHNLTAKDIYGENQKMSSYKGQIILIVNTASNCGFTHQLEGLEILYQKYKEKGFVILGFPCNQFANQEPSSEDQIVQGCMSKYSITFPMFSKVNVNGKDAHPLFEYLKSNLSGILGKRIKWNFTKFLIDSEGAPIKRFAPTTPIKSIEMFLLKKAFV